MTWQAAIAEALHLARIHPGYRFYVTGYRHIGSHAQWRYEARQAGRVLR